MELYIVHELDNPDWLPSPNEFLSRHNAIARARVVPDRTMGVYRAMPSYGERLEAITHNGNVCLLVDIPDSTETERE